MLLIYNYMWRQKSMLKVWIQVQTSKYENVDLKELAYSLTCEELMCLLSWVKKCSKIFSMWNICNKSILQKYKLHNTTVHMVSIRHSTVKDKVDVSNSLTDGKNKTYVTLASNSVLVMIGQINWLRNQYQLSCATMKFHQLLLNWLGPCWKCL